MVSPAVLFHLVVSRREKKLGFLSIFHWPHPPHPLLSTIPALCYCYPQYSTQLWRKRFSALISLQFSFSNLSNLCNWDKKDLLQPLRDLRLKCDTHQKLRKYLHERERETGCLKSQPPNWHWDSPILNFWGFNVNCFPGTRLTFIGGLKPPLDT